MRGNVKHNPALVQNLHAQTLELKYFIHKDYCGAVENSEKFEYPTQDHFLEEDTSEHCWEALAKLFEEGYTDDIICDFGMPVMHHGTRYNCRVMALNRRILLIRPKLFMANDGNYRETRWFTRWQHGWVLQDHVLPPVMIAATSDKQQTAPMGPGMLELNDTIVAAETW
jgi:NAD+ synthase (glutamine-hydrolysing)